jgi:O-acetyl-ADP-ribose deacetylase (regulator of RNase III)
MSLCTAELSYLPDRRQAYENLARRTDHAGVKAVAMALIQAERYGTPLGAALRVMAKENRELRMTEAEKRLRLAGKADRSDDRVLPARARRRRRWTRDHPDRVPAEPAIVRVTAP